jgi:hypothetical protein
VHQQPRKPPGALCALLAPWYTCASTNFASIWPY